MDPAAYPTHPRGTVFAENGMAAASHPAASLAAIDILRAGGSAMDAAIAAHLVLAVVEPMSTGIGGDAFCLYAPAGAARPLAYNGAGRAPAGVSAEALRAGGASGIDPDSAHAVTIPGAVDAFLRLHEEHGRLDRERVFAPAIGLARDGMVVAPVVARHWQLAAARLRQREVAAATFLPAGRPPVAGDRFAQPLLAATLECLAREGRAAFYEGWIAEDLVATLAAAGGSHRLDDLAAHRGEWVTPIAGDLAGCRVWQCPPSGQGVIALLMLNLLADYGMAAMDPLGAERLHLTLEAGRLAFRERGRLLADPAEAPVPVEEWLSEAHAERLRRHIRPDQAMAALPPVDLPHHQDTVYACVVDRERNVASLISSLYHSFGACITAPGSGVNLHCRGVGFSLQEGHPNCLAPGRRPMHTIIPGMLAEGDRAVMAFGVMGADYQPWGHVHVLQNLLLYGMQPQAALDLPRFTHDGGAGLALVEEGIPRATCRELARLGHTVAMAPEPLGGGQLVRIDWQRGTLAGASEPRKDGIALGY